ncbi:hypothetical protein KCM76_10870 [Zooshikella marina]|uniref:hypothetical protein n=1 Tax=Zooshikella ganghwensis TaxID=202772 RepID=UPI001BAEA1B0|nr:hypothetical protein [Zooshikella ganghwensis]MBU2706489.1 hypothetical protein [Zooshikella ganghwensis]
MTNAVSFSLDTIFDNTVAAVSKQAELSTKELSQSLTKNLQSIADSLAATKLPVVSQSIAQTLKLEQNLVENSLQSIWQASGGVENLLTNSASALSGVKEAFSSTIKKDVIPALMDSAQNNLSDLLSENFNVKNDLVSQFVGDIRSAIGNPFNLAENLPNIGESLKAALQGDAASNLAKDFAGQYIGGASEAILSAFKVKSEVIENVATRVTTAFTSVDNLITDFPQALDNVGSAIVDIGQQHLTELGESLANNTSALISRRANLVLNTFATKGFSAGVKSLTRQLKLLGRLGFLKARRALITFTSGIRLATARFWAFNASILANPLAAVIAGIVVAVAAIGVIIYKYWDPIKAFMSGLFDGLLNAIEPVRQALAPLFNTLEPLFSAIGTAIDWLVSGFNNLFTPVQATAAELSELGSIGSTVGNVLGAVFSFLLSPITLVAEGISWLTDKLLGMADLVSGVFGNIIGFFSDDEDENKSSGNKAKSIKAIQESSLARQTVSAKASTGVPQWRGSTTSFDTTNVVDLNQYRAVKFQAAYQSDEIKNKSMNGELGINTGALGKQNVTPIKAHSTPQSVAVNAPITINATANQNAQDIAMLVRKELAQREQQAQLKTRGALYDIG